MSHLHVRAIACAAAAGLVVAQAPAAQTPAPSAFEVATIKLTKPGTPGDGGPGFRLVFQGARLPGRNASMAQLAFVLQAIVLDRPVLDKTGLAGNFDFDLSWAPNETQFGGRGGTMPADPDSPDIFTAVQEQLGLKLESQKDPVDVLMIDHAEKPSAN